LAHELGLPVGVVRLNAVISSFLGDTASHLHRVFNLANTTPMVLLLDEVDAVGKNRDDPNDVGELKRVVNSLLQAMDTFDSSKSIIIAASNHQYLLDPALWRRFDALIEFPLPGKTEREIYLQRLLNGVEFDGSLEYSARI
jgi:AAA+ superfamily predicted ATPase